MSLAEALDQEISDQNIALERYDLKPWSRAAYFDDAALRCPVIILDKRVDVEYEINGLKAHELGHHYSCPGNLLEMSPRLRIKYETLANRWSLNRTMSLDKLLEAYLDGVRSQEDLSDHLEISLEFIMRGFTLYESIYGPEVQHNGYTITWDPFNIELSEEDETI